jgi:hypothetical protein
MRPPSQAESITPITPSTPTAGQISALKRAICSDESRVLHEAVQAREAFLDAPEVRVHAQQEEVRHHRHHERGEEARQQQLGVQHAHGDGREHQQKAHARQVEDHRAHHVADAVEVVGGARHEVARVLLVEEGLGLRHQRREQVAAQRILHRARRRDHPQALEVKEQARDGRGREHRAQREHDGPHALARAQAVEDDFHHPRVHLVERRGDHHERPAPENGPAMLPEVGLEQRETFGKTVLFRGGF